MRQKIRGGGKDKKELRIQLLCRFMSWYVTASLYSERLSRLIGFIVILFIYTYIHIHLGLN